MLALSGDSPSPVPGRILMPILDYASVEDDDAMQRKWGALLANAASHTEANKVLPAFAEILRQLTPVQAQILEWMYEMEENNGPNLFPTWPDVARNDIESRFSLSYADSALLITDLERLQLIEPRRDIEEGKRGIEIPMDQMLQLVVDRWNSRVRYEWIGFTALGLRFVMACTPPQKPK
jgi:hypothetical protein